MNGWTKLGHDGPPLPWRLHEVLWCVRRRPLESDKAYVDANEGLANLTDGRRELGAKSVLPYDTLCDILCGGWGGGDIMD